MNESKNIYQENKDNAETDEPVCLDRIALIKLMECLKMTHEGACSCMEAFAQLDEYVERLTAHEQMAELMPLVKTHLDMCAGCREELEILLNILRAERLELA